MQKKRLSLPVRDLKHRAFSLTGRKILSLLLAGSLAIQGSGRLSRPDPQGVRLWGQTKQAVRPLFEEEALAPTARAFTRPAMEASPAASSLLKTFRSSSVEPDEQEKKRASQLEIQLQTLSRDRNFNRLTPQDRTAILKNPAPENISRVLQSRGIGIPGGFAKATGRLLGNPKEKAKKEQIQPAAPSPGLTVGLEDAPVVYKPRQPVQGELSRRFYDMTLLLMPPMNNNEAPEKVLAIFNPFVSATVRALEQMSVPPATADRIRKALEEMQEAIRQRRYNDFMYTLSPLLNRELFLPYEGCYVYIGFENSRWLIHWVRPMYWRNITVHGRPSTIVVLKKGRLAQFTGIQRDLLISEEVVKDQADVGRIVLHRIYEGDRIATAQASLEQCRNLYLWHWFYEELSHMVDYILLRPSPYKTQPPTQFIRENSPLADYERAHFLGNLGFMEIVASLRIIMWMDNKFEAFVKIIDEIFGETDPNHQDAGNFLKPIFEKALGLQADYSTRDALTALEVLGLPALRRLARDTFVQNLLLPVDPEGFPTLSDDGTEVIEGPEMGALLRELQDFFDSQQAGSRAIRSSL